MPSCFTSLSPQKPLWLHRLPLPSGWLHPGCSYSLEHLFACETIKADNLTLLFRAGREQARRSGDEQWEHSVGSLFSPHPSLQCHHPSPRHWDTPQRNRHTDRLSSVFVTQKGRTTSTKVAEKRIRESLSLKFWIFWIFPPGNKPIIFQRKH